MLALKPPVFQRSERPDKSLFTIHSQQNTVYATRPDNEKLWISVVSFRSKENAYMIASMLEEYKRKTSEWPLLLSDDSVFLPAAEAKNSLDELQIIRWTQDELKMYCVEHILDLITINTIDNTKEGLSMFGDTYQFEVPTDFYRQMFEAKLD
jgi:hypothetical protein